jgi:hypothetical protein
MQASPSLDGFIGLLSGELVRDVLAFAFRPTLHMARVQQRPE